MKAPSGFGKHYFRLSSILAYSVAPVLLALESAASVCLYSVISAGRESKEENPPDEELLIQLAVTPKPYHCNCFFKHKARLILLLNHYIPRCPYYTTYYAFRRSGVHPPYLSF